MHTDSFEKLYIDELRDVYNAEKQLVRAIPKMAKAAHSSELRSALEEHLEVTRGQVERLEELFRDLGRPATGKTCKGMAGIIEEGQDVMEEDVDEIVLDAGIIAAAQKVEHYEIASYGTLRAFAETRGDRKAVEVFEEILEQEKEADQTLTRIAESSINALATDREDSEAMEEEEDSESEETGSRPRPRAGAQARGRSGNGSARAGRGR